MTLHPDLRRLVDDWNHPESRHLEPCPLFLILVNEGRGDVPRDPDLEVYLWSNGRGLIVQEIRRRSDP